MICDDKTNVDYESLLMEYASGSLDPAHTLIISAYLTLSPEARRFVSVCETLGAALMEHCCGLDDLSPQCMEKVLDAITAGNQECASSPCAPCGCTIDCAEPLPRSVQNALPDPEEIKWRRAFGGMEWVDIPFDNCKSRARLVRCAPGFRMPHHEHRGAEITLVLDGAFTDGSKKCRRGDLVIEDSDRGHAPVADADSGCLCLTVSESPIRFTGILTRLLNPFV